MKTYDDKTDCPPVEEFIWEKVAMSYGDFEGIRELTFMDLMVLKNLIDHQLREIVREAEMSHE